jgi:hypothetical protein
MSLNGLFERLSKGGKNMNNAMMKRIAGELIGLRNEIGKDEHDNWKVRIPGSRAEAMRILRKYTYRAKGSYSCDDPEVVNEAKNLVSRFGEVWLIANTETLEYELYVPPQRY